MPTAVVIYDSKIFRRGGIVDDWAKSVQRTFVGHAKIEAPIRSGELKKGIRSSRSHPGTKRVLINIWSRAPHTMYVLKGTTGPIMSRRMWGFRSRTGLTIPRGGAYDGNVFNTSRDNINRDFLRTHGYMLRVRAGNGHPERYALSVSGQDANNFMGRAAEATAKRHRSLRGFSPGFNY